MLFLKSVLYLIYLLIFPISILYVIKFKPVWKKSILIIVVGFCFALVPFVNNPPLPESIYLNSGKSSVVVLGENMMKKVDIVLNPKNADLEVIVFLSDDYSVAYIEDGVIHALHEGETFVYAKFGNFVSNKVKVVVDYKNFADREEDDGYVFITSNGTKYHKSDCSTINPTVYKLTEDEAEDRGAKPCKYCFEN